MPCKHGRSQGNTARASHYALGTLANRRNTARASHYALGTRANRRNTARASHYALGTRAFTRKGEQDEVQKEKTLKRHFVYGGRIGHVYGRIRRGYRLCPGRLPEQSDKYPYLHCRRSGAGYGRGILCLHKRALPSGSYLRARYYDTGNGKPPAEEGKWGSKRRFPAVGTRRRNGNGEFSCHTKKESLSNTTGGKIYG